MCDKICAAILGKPRYKCIQRTHYKNASSGDSPVRKLLSSPADWLVQNFGKHIILKNAEVK